MRVQETSHYSYRIGALARGCSLCVKGLKEVVFVTGVCGKRCFFCPLSEAKKSKDVVYANEMPINRLADIVTEAKLCDSKGAGITGGDPMLRLDRTVKVIRLLKRRFDDFHIHLYTPLQKVSLERLGRLHNAGLDEIRFHPDLGNRQEWKKISLAKQFSWDVGVEIPVIPGYEAKTRELIEFVCDKVDFLNLNELEISSTNAEALFSRGFAAKDRSSYAIKGSEVLAMRLLAYCDELQQRTHYCTTTLKDKVQLAKRIKRRARNIAQEYDQITRDGTLIRGAVYLDELVPSFGYRKMILKADRKSALARLKDLRRALQKGFKVSGCMLYLDEKKLRLLTSASLAKKFAKNIPNQCAVVEEYPTYDQFEVDVQFL